MSSSTTPHMTLHTTPQWGLTGNIGSGKSTVADLLRTLGAAVIDADALGHEATAQPLILKRIAQALGEEVVKDGHLDRAATARIVFQDEQALTHLNQIVHPYIHKRRAEIAAQLQALPSPPPVIIHDIPLLYEMGLGNDMDGVIVVSAPIEMRIARVKKRSGLSEDEVRARDNAQMPQAEKVRRADLVLDNSGTVAELQMQAKQMLKPLFAQR